MYVYTIYLFTDGAIRNAGNKNKKKSVRGCAGGLIVDPNTGEEDPYHFNFKNVTILEMELYAVLYGLLNIHNQYINGQFPVDKLVVRVFVDNKSVMMGLDVWSHNWLSNNFKTNLGNDIKHQKLWKIAISLYYQSQGQYTTLVQWLKSHVTIDHPQTDEDYYHIYNNKVDADLKRYIDSHEPTEDLNLDEVLDKIIDLRRLEEV